MIHLLAHNVCLSNLSVINFQAHYFLVSTLPSLPDLGVWIYQYYLYLLSFNFRITFSRQGCRFLFFTFWWGFRV
jgi:hypothetical protein